MNKIETDFSVLVSPAAPIGLEISGPKSDSIISRIQKARLQAVGSLVLMASAVACGSGKEAKISTPSATASPTIPVATETRTPVSTPTAAAKAETPSAGPTEAAKAQVREQIPVTLKAISSEVTSYQAVDQTRRDDIVADIKISNDALVKGNTDQAREALLRLKNNIRQISLSSNVVIISKDIRLQHDPQNKYIKDDAVINSGFLDEYLEVIDMLVAIDPSYGQPGK